MHINKRSSTEDDVSSSSYAKPLTVYRALWLLVHTIFRWYAAARRTWLQAVQSLAQRFEPTTGDYAEECDETSATAQRERELIAKCRADLAKVPVHVAVILNERCDNNGTNDQISVAAEETAALERLIRWVSYTGIEYISFYDFRGTQS